MSGHDADQRPVYRSYLLRFWKELGRHPGAPGQWRFSLEDPHTNRRRGFGDLEKLISFLQQETGQPDLALPAPSTAGEEQRGQASRVLESGTNSCAAIGKEVEGEAEGNCSQP